MNESLRQLYQSIILKHNQDPVQFIANRQAMHTFEAYNPICGDQFNVYFDLEDGQIKNLSFYGYGCAISKAATSVLVSHMEGKDLNENLRLCETYNSIISPNEEALSEGISEELSAFAAAKQFPGRLKCATLSWGAMEEFLKSISVK